MMQPLMIVLICLSLFFGVISKAQGQTKPQTQSQTRYLSDVDSSLFIDKVSIIPFADNVGQIYSQPLTQTAQNYFEKGQQWTPKLSATKFESENLTPAEVKKTAAKDSSQAVLTGRIWKGPQGVQIRLVLYLATDGLPLLIEASDSLKSFSIEALSRDLTTQLVKLYQKLPTQGLVLSRRANEVTVNLGEYHGLQAGDVLNVVQVIKLKRHPKQQFIIGHDKILLGQIKLFKVDQFLSFGQISLEKEPGVIQVNAKLNPDQFIQYSVADDGTIKTLREKLQQRPESAVAFGDKAEEWKPRPPPQYGSVQLKAGFTQYNQNLAFQTAGSLSASNSLAPMVALSGEAWLNDEWFFNLGTKLSSFSVSNSLAGSSPGSITMALSQYNLGFGHNFLFENNFWGPKIQLSLGISQFSVRVDDSSPIFLGGMDYGGMYLGFKGAFPLGEEIPYDLGFQFKYFMTNSLTESKSSGSPSGTRITDFGFFGAYKTKRGFNVIGELNFEYYTSNFAGTGVRTSDPVSNISHKLTTLLAGVEYFF